MKIKSSISFIFNQYDKEEIECLNANIKDIEKNIANRGAQTIDEDANYLFEIFKE